MKKGLLWIVALAVLPLVGTACGGGTSSGGGGSQESKDANIHVVAGKSFCTPTGVSDVYTGDGKVIFYVTLRNTGGKTGSFSFTPVRHYDDGQVNESALDEASVDDVKVGVSKVRTPAMKYKAHEHEVVGCGIKPGDGDEIKIEVIHF